MSTSASPVVVGSSAPSAAGRATCRRRAGGRLPPSPPRTARRSRLPGAPGCWRCRTGRPRRGRHGPSGRTAGCPGWSANPGISFGRAERHDTVRADPPLDVEIARRLEVVGPGERHEPAVRGDRPTLVPIRDPSCWILEQGHGQRTRSRRRPTSGGGTTRWNHFDVSRYGLLDSMLQKEPAMGESEDGIRQRWRPECRRASARERPSGTREPGVRGIGQQDRHRKTALCLRVEQRLAGERLAVDP